MKFLTMALSKLRTDFRRAVNRTAVSLFLGAALLAPITGHAQQASDTAAATPTPIAEMAVQATPGTELQLEKGVISTVAMEVASDVDSLAKEYPFLADQVQFAKEVYESSGQQTTFSTARAVDAETNTQLLFVSQTGSVTCGALGCTLTVYANNGEGYKEALNLLAFGNVYVGKNDSGKISTYFCANESYTDWKHAEWQLNGTKFELQRTHAQQQQPVVNGKPLCSTAAP